MLFFVIVQAGFSQITFELKTTPTTDFNVISIPENAGYERASDLMAAIPNCNSVAVWSLDIQGWNQYVPGIDQTNFNIVPGAYYVNVTRESTFTVYGIWSFNQTVVDGQSDYILLNPEITTSIELSEYLGREIEKWDVDQQGYVGGYFPVEFGHAYHIQKINTGLTTDEIEYRLMQNYPNPFNSSTVIQYEAGPGQTELLFMNTLGQVIDQTTQTHSGNGVYEYIWSPDISTGVYFCKINNQVIKLVKVN